LGCERLGLKKCKIQAGSQLTFKEQEIIYNLVNSKVLNHLSIKRLQYYSFRKKSRTGIRSKRINEIWYMDITEFILSCGSKAYLQVIVDNYSR